ncbi:MAG: cell wall hydrolase [Clostridia bacterium]|nr:cell wall hydrolase [Clostridia bacterium]
MKERQKRRTRLLDAGQRSGIALLLAALLLAGGRIGAGAAEQEEAHDGARATATGMQTEALRSASAEGRARDTATTVYLDGREILVGECVIRDSITYVPLRKFCNLFADCQFSWNGQTKTATVTAEGLTMTVQEGAVYITANGHVYYTVGEVINKNGSLYVPIRPLARTMNLALSWNAGRRCVELSEEGRKSAFVSWANYNKDDLYWLSRIISAESRGEPIEGQIAVGNVVLNRVRSRSYPNTIYGVIFDRKHGTQFSPVSFGTIYNPPAASSILAAKMCLEGYTLSEDILFFMNPRIATNSWISKNRPYAFTIGNHDFYR